MKDGRLVCIYAYIGRAEHGGRIVRKYNAKREHGQIGQKGGVDIRAGVCVKGASYAFREGRRWLLSLILERLFPALLAK